MGESLDLILKEAREGVITLLYAARNRENNNAVALKKYLEANLHTKRNLRYNSNLVVDGLGD